MKKYRLFYRSESEDCTGEWYGSYPSIAIALKEMTSLIPPDAEILAIFQAGEVLVDFAC